LSALPSTNLVGKHAISDAVKKAEGIMKDIESRYKAN